MKSDISIFDNPSQILPTHPAPSNPAPGNPPSNNPPSSTFFTKQLGISIGQLKTNLEDTCNAVTADTSGNIYCAGSTKGSLGETNGGNGDAFVMKLAPSGDLLWIRQLGDVTSVPGGDSSSDDYCTGITVDSSNNVYCAGATMGSLGEANGAGSNDAFVMKLSSSGNLLWIKQLGAVTSVPGGDTSSGDSCSGVTVDSFDNVYCAGWTDSSLGETNGGMSDAFVIKLAPDGSHAL